MIVVADTGPIHYLIPNGRLGFVLTDESLGRRTAITPAHRAVTGMASGA